MAKKIKLLRILETAEMLGVNPETLRRWDRQGRLKAIRVGNRGDRRYKNEEIVKIMKNNWPVKNRRESWKLSLI